MTVREAAEAFGVTRQSVYRWMARYEEGGLEALVDRSHRPRRVPHQMTLIVAGLQGLVQREKTAMKSRWLAAK